MSCLQPQSTPEPVQMSAEQGVRFRMRGTHVRAVPLLASLNLQNIHCGSAQVERRVRGVRRGGAGVEQALVVIA